MLYSYLLETANICNTIVYKYSISYLLKTAVRCCKRTVFCLLKFDTLFMFNSINYFFKCLIVLVVCKFSVNDENVNKSVEQATDCMYITKD